MGTTVGHLEVGTYPAGFGVWVEWKDGQAIVETLTESAAKAGLKVGDVVARPKDAIICRVDGGDVSAVRRWAGRGAKVYKGRHYEF